MYVCMLVCMFLLLLFAFCFGLEITLTFFSMIFYCCRCFCLFVCFFNAFAHARLTTKASNEFLSSYIFFLWYFMALLNIFFVFFLLQKCELFLKFERYFFLSKQIQNYARLPKNLNKKQIRTKLPYANNKNAKKF